MAKSNIVRIEFSKNRTPRIAGECVELEKKLADYYTGIGVAFETNNPLRTKQDVLSGVKHEAPCEGCTDEAPCEGCEKANDIELASAPPVEVKKKKKEPKINKNSVK